MTFPARRRNPLPIVIAIVVGLFAICGVYLVLANRVLANRDDNGGSTEGRVPRREGCIPLAVSASSEKAAPSWC